LLEGELRLFSRFSCTLLFRHHHAVLKQKQVALSSTAAGGAIPDGKVILQHQVRGHHITITCLELMTHMFVVTVTTRKFSMFPTVGSL